MSEAGQPRVALVAGASGGIGRVIARRFAADGYAVGLTYLDGDEHAEGAAGEIEAGGGRAELFGGVDLGDGEATERLVSGVAERLGRIDAVIYAAGPWIPIVWLSELEPEMWKQVVQADVGGCFNLCHFAIPHLRQSQGCVVALTTPALRRHRNADSMSSVPKAAVEALMRGVASEEGKFGVRANSVGCGITDAGLVHRLVEEGYFGDEYFEGVRRNIPLQRMAQPEEITEAVAFLANPEQAGYISGQSLVVDGGYTA